jgi:probable F420-dependent oxidoreductase
MKIAFGVNLAAMNNVAHFAQSAESFGYDYVGCPEHVMLNQPVPNSLIGLAVAAGATSRIKLMSTVVPLPLYNPAVLAKQVSVLDVMSNGRFHLGIGVGGEHPKEFEACGVPVNQRGSRTDEALRVMKKLWTEGNVTFEGRYTKFSGVTILPHPVQQPHPPIWVGGRKEPSMRRAALYGDGWLPYLSTAEMVRVSIERIRQFGADAGRDLTAMPTALTIATALDPDRERAINRVATVSGRGYGKDFTKFAERYSLSGTPADCRRRIAEYIQAGVGTFMLALVTGPREEERALRQFAEEVMPEFKQTSETA